MPVSLNTTSARRPGSRLPNRCICYAPVWSDCEQLLGCGAHFACRPLLLEMIGQRAAPFAPTPRRAARSFWGTQLVTRRLRAPGLAFLALRDRLALIIVLRVSVGSRPPQLALELPTGGVLRLTTWGHSYVFTQLRVIITQVLSFFASRRG